MRTTTGQPEKNRVWVTRCKDLLATLSTVYRLGSEGSETDLAELADEILADHGVGLSGEPTEPRGEWEAIEGAIGAYALAQQLYADIGTDDTLASVNIKRLELRRLVQPTYLSGEPTEEGDGLFEFGVNLMRAQAGPEPDTWRVVHKDPSWEHPYPNEHASREDAIAEADDLYLADFKDIEGEQDGPGEPERLDYQVVPVWIGKPPPTIGEPTQGEMEKLERWPGFLHHDGKNPETFVEIDPNNEGPPLLDELPSGTPVIVFLATAIQSALSSSGEIERDRGVVEAVAAYLETPYPESVFPEPTEEDYETVDGTLRGRMHASWARHWAGVIRENTDRILAPNGEGEDDKAGA